MREILFKQADIFIIRPPPRINRLIIIAYHADIIIRNQMHHLILLNTRVLKLIHHHIPVAVLVHRKHIRMFGKKLNRQHNQIVKIHRIEQLEPRLIFVVQRTIHRRLCRKVFLPRLYLRKQRPHSVHIERFRCNFQFLRRLLNQLIAVYLIINAKILPPSQPVNIFPQDFHPQRVKSTNR